MDIYQFPEQNVLCKNQPISRKLLSGLLDKVFETSAPITGYLRISDSAVSHFFLFFFKGAPYAAGEYVNGKPAGFTIGELGTHLQSADVDSMTVTFSEIDPVLLKNMFLLLHKKPLIKATTDHVDLDVIVRQFGVGKVNAMISLCRNTTCNFFFFRDGKAALSHYADRDFERPEGLTLEEELHSYAYQPGSKVEACVFREMVTAEAEDARQFDRDMLLTLLSGGKTIQADDEVVPPPITDTVMTSRQQPDPMSVTLCVESGPQQGETHTVKLPCLIGRKDCDLVLNDSEISRQHAELKIVGHKVVIEDLMSTNGTQVNGITITRTQLAPNDLVTVGETSLRILPA
jgi:Inner membrane component of T3SS, cytoplasmic domain